MKCVGLIVFCVGGGSKLLQSQLDGVKNISSIPGYPLKYFYKHWDEWKKKHKLINSNLALKLITKHHASILDSRMIPGNNGLRNLGKKRNNFIKISKNKFSLNFKKYLKKKEINTRNIILAIHIAYFLSKKKKQLPKNFLFHIHEAQYFNNYAVKDFKKMKLLVCCRDPINYFWKRVRLDKNIEKENFNVTDRILLRQYDYINSLNSMFQGFANLKNNFFKNYHFIKFEDLKKNNFQTLKKIGKYLKINITKKKTNPSFDGLEWWSDAKYDKHHKKTFDGKIYDYSKDFKNFFPYEINILKYVLNPFFKKVGYNSLTIQKNVLKNFFIVLTFLFPTKFGIKTLLFYLNPLNFLYFTKFNFLETFSKKKLKNYYFHAMYKHKDQYGDRLFLNYNYLRKFIFKYERNKKMELVIFSLKILLFLLNNIFYFGACMNIVLLYFRRIAILASNFFILKAI